MAIIKAKPTSPGRRFRVHIREELYKGRPEKTLLESKKEFRVEIIMGISLCAIRVEVTKDYIE